MRTRRLEERLTDLEREKIRRLLSQGVSRKSIAARFQVTYTTIHVIANQMAGERKMFAEKDSTA